MTSPDSRSQEGGVQTPPSAGRMAPCVNRGVVSALTRTEGVSFDSWILGVTSIPASLGLPSTITPGLTEIISVLGLSPSKGDSLVL